jgi:hypothetical protein
VDDCADVGCVLGAHMARYLADILTRIVNGPTARSTIFLLGPTFFRPTSRPWPENTPLSSGSLPIRGMAAHSDDRAWVEAELKDVGGEL